MPLRALLIAATLLTPVTAAAQNVAGPYLAARIAGFGNDYDAAADYYATLLRADNVPADVLESALVVYGALGRFDEGVTFADRMTLAGGPSRFATGIRMVDALLNERYDRASALLLDGDGVGGALLDGMLDGWLAVAQGDPDAADERFDALAETPSYASFARQQQAYALALAGEYAAADDILAGRTHGPLPANVRAVEAHAQILAELDRPDDALELLEEIAAQANNPVLRDMQARLEAGEEIGWDFITTPREGLAEAYFTLAAILAGETSPTFTLVNAQAAAALRPDHVDALVLIGGLFDEQEQYDLADAVLGRVPADHPSFFGAEIERAEVLLASDREDAAVEVLRSLSRAHPDEIVVWTALGDALRRLDRFALAADAYDQAVELLEEPGPRDWFLFYARAIARERMGRFDQAEPDFRRALELNPEQPLVLNYLGYSLVEARRDLDEALGMIERAVEARPDDGFITDSLGWVLYRLGRYEEAVAPMERAVQLEPLDPIINDHFGDVLWTVGREREARFQWRRALSLDPEEDEVARIRRKLDVGLDVVLAEEAAEDEAGDDGAATE
ncbi:tetratricopeptide repeat protein [Jannaschia sp. LMIT008]|uniref:tetratricopeptide repeat protein n=1 Tax=Jannaschia maritima TaxID=3032585 RepID=UPI002812252A|nr:tetratricopeptide repeat protein [Jannaschia sp. LMIT008]